MCSGVFQGRFSTTLQPASWTNVCERLIYFRNPRHILKFCGILHFGRQI
jgi:hypothetical protein